MRHNPDMYAARGWLSRMGLVLTAWVLLAACGAHRQEGAGSGTPASGMSIEEIRYRLTGGIAGFDLELGLAGGGEFTVDETGRPARRGRLTADEWRQVEQLAVAVQAAELRPQYGIPGAVVDAFAEVVTVAGGGRTTAVAIAGDPRDEPPPSVRELADRMREIALTGAR